MWARAGVMAAVALALTSTLGASPHVGADDIGVADIGSDSVGLHVGRATVDDSEAPLCTPPDPPAYYRIDLVSTRRVPRTARSRGTGEVTFSSASPFGIALTQDGSYHYDVQLSFQRLPEPIQGVYAVWLTTTQLDEVLPLGVLEMGRRELTGTAEWNQFLVVVSLEPSIESVGDRWSGPIVLRGISRSGLMHTMAGHGPFEQENCAAYGYE